MTCQVFLSEKAQRDLGFLSPRYGFSHVLRRRSPTRKLVPHPANGSRLGEQSTFLLPLSLQERWSIVEEGLISLGRSNSG